MNLPESVLFGLFPNRKFNRNFHEELHDIFNANGYEIHTKETLNQFLKWSSLPNKKIPNVIITDIDIYTRGVKNTLQEFKNTRILLVDPTLKISDIEDLNGVRLYMSHEELFADVQRRFSSNPQPEKVENDFPEEEPDKHNFWGDYPSTSDIIYSDDNVPPDNMVDMDAVAEEMIKDVSNYSIWDESENNIVDVEEEVVVEEVVAAEKTHEEGPSEQAIPTENSVSEEDIFFNRSKEIRRQWSKSLKWKSHRTIGVWSPLHRTGVTSFTFNYGFYLASKGIKSAVLEGLTDNYTMRNWLKRYTQEPENWSSLAKAIHSDNLPDQTLWEYGDVRFFPLDKGDNSYDWNANSLRYLIQTTNDIKATLVDLPTGEMNRYTIDSLAYMDELWIIVDDAIQETIAWKSYITDLQKQSDIPFRLIFNKEFKFSQSKRLSDELDVPLITCLPSLHEETMRNYYENNPLYFKKEVAELLEEPFEELTSYLFADSPEVPVKRGSKMNMYLNITKRFESLFKK